MAPALEQTNANSLAKFSDKLQSVPICFDIFDTLLTRAVAKPEHVFLLLGRRLCESGALACTPEIFARQRAYSEERASLCKGTHPTLKLIYEELVRSFGLPPYTLDFFMGEELKLETELVRRVPGAERLLAAARERSGLIAFITDTNLPSYYLRDLLGMHGCWQPGDRIFASCECGVDKGRGMMFPHVARELGFRPWNFILHGNDDVADVRNGRLSGWKVRHTDDTKLNRYEEALASESFATGGLSSLMAGASRLARLSTKSFDKREHAICEVTAGVMAPTLTAWVLWIMRRTMQSGCKKVYFISRDGQVLVDIAQRLEAVLRTGLELRYLYGSRQAVQFAGSPHDAVRDLMRLGTCRINDLRELLNVTPEELASVLPDKFRDHSRWERNLTSPEREELKIVLGGERLRILINESSWRTRNLLLAYLRQEGWGDAEPFTLVDVGWRASMAGALSQTLENEPIRKPDQYLFFGLADDAYRVAGPLACERLEAWFFDDASKHGYLPYLASTTSLMEMFCAADHGSVIGYRQEGNEIQPVLRTADSPMKGWGLPRIHQITAAYADAFAQSIKAELCDPYTDVRHGLREVLRLFWLEPSSEEARWWGTFPVEVNLNNSHVRPLAAPMKTGEIARSFMAGQLVLRPQHSWPKGTALASSWPFRALFWCLNSFKAGLPRFQRRIAWFQAQFATAIRRRAADPGAGTAPK
jgi:FMN phosphatase YigB (HAD superfamily)